MDSCPGAVTYIGSLRAFAQPIANPLVRYFTYFAVTIAYPFAWILWTTQLVADPFSKLSRMCNNQSIIGNAPRAYIYSESDRLVQSWAVEAHAQDAEKKGLPMRLHRWSNSEHVAHLRSDKMRYIEVIKAMEESPIRGSILRLRLTYISGGCISDLCRLRKAFINVLPHTIGIGCSCNS